MKPQPYTRLTGFRRRWFSIDSLWRAEDHLLLVQRQGYTENYRRYYFSAIQGFVITPNNTSVALGAISGVPLVAAAVVTTLTLLGTLDVAWSVGVDILALPWLFVFIINWIRGPTCTTYLCTAVADVLLAPLGRQRDAQRLIPVIAQAIWAVQGSLDLESHPPVDSVPPAIVVAAPTAVGNGSP